MQRPTIASPIDVPIDQLSSGFRLIGRLGKPLGDVVKIQGIVVDGPSKGYEGGPNILVQRIDGEATQKYLRMPICPYFRNWGAVYVNGKGPPELANGCTFELDGYESGGFVGIPGDACRRAGEMIQTRDHYFRCGFSVFDGERIEPIRYSPSDFVDREALFEGMARNKDGRPTLAGEGWELRLERPPWDRSVEGRLVEAFGTARKVRNGIFRLENNASSRAGLVNLEDQVGQPVSLRGRALSSSGEWWFQYRSEALYVEDFERLLGADSPHGEPVLIRGLLEKSVLPDLEQISLTSRDKRDKKEYYIVRRASWERTTPLLLPETGPSGFPRSFP